ncbi:amidohydrolase family protein [Caulobacter sp. 17J80-11]|uniref:amidohydrolase family protein n=1 Tax=Caulobacter sp. 17J80-11 TaxID=2763502 RepID=UPI00165352CE|nr:amidohydrolase family protein [Caulobacter sp. 17J80-11]MBC6981303.1 PD40 domain-containing protein [Caulobacter sp. 17J80-11]
MKRVSLAVLAAAAFGAAASLAHAQAAAPAPAVEAKADAKKSDEKPKWDVNNPPGPHHDVTIDTTTGTWLSLDVSPDGKEVAFDLLGDLYVMPIGGGEAKALTSGVAWDMQPRYSPNGKWIAFTSDRGGGDNIWIMDRDGSNVRQVTKETFRLLNQADWSPDSEYIVARKHFTSARSLGAGEMWLYHRSGGDGLQLTKKRTEQKDTNEPAFSPDGRYVYFSDDATPGGQFEYSKDPNSQIYVIRRLDRETGDVEPFVTGPGGSIRPTPSPDGKSLAFIRRVRYKSVLYVMDLESGRETPVYDGLDRDMQETWAVHGVYPGMSWTPDNKSIVFWAGGKIKRIDVGSKKVADIPFHVKSTRQVEEAVRAKVEVAPDTFDVKMLRWTAPSPDGSKVVYEALGKLWIKDLKGGGEPKRLTSQKDHFELYPSWSRDGKSIVYTTWSDTDYGTVRVVSAAGGAGRVVTEKPGHYIEPSFSPDGKTIAYRTSADGYLRPAVWGRQDGIWTVPAAGGKPTLVTKDGVLPQWGARNDRLFFMTYEPEQKRALRSIEVDGSDAHTWLMTTAATEFAVAPDEKYVAWTERYNAFVAPFPATGKTVDIGPDNKSMPVTRVSKDAGDWLHWSGDGKALSWSTGPEFFTRELKDAFAFVDGAPKDLPGVQDKGVNIGFKATYAKPQGKYALVGARIITMKGDEVIENGVIVVDGNRIESIGSLAATTLPAGMKTIDVSGKTIIPGLIDAHWHGAMGSDEIIPQQSWVNYAALAFGVTTLHDPSNDTSEIFAASELSKAGEIVAPRIFSTGTILYGATAAYTAKIDSLDDALSNLRRLKAVGAFSVKSYNQPRREQRQQIIEAARELDMSVVPEGGSLFEHNMTMVVDGHTTLEHSLPVAKIYDDVKQLWSKAGGTAYTPTLIVAYGGNSGENYWYQETDVWADPILSKYVPRRILDDRSRRHVEAPLDEMNHIDIAKAAKELNDLGVSVQMGAHGQREGLGAHWELWMMAQGGMSPMQVLRVGTINGARALGMDKDIGSLEPGKLADLVVLDANPLDDIRNTHTIRYTIANGRVFDTEMNEMGKPAHKPFWFTQDGGEAWNRSNANTEASTGAHGEAHGHDGHVD